MKLFKPSGYDTIVSKHANIAEHVPTTIKEFELDFFHVFTANVSMEKGSSKFKVAVKIIKVGKSSWVTNYKNGEVLPHYLGSDAIIEVLHDPNLKAEEIKEKSEAAEKPAKESKAQKAAEEQK